MNAPNPSPEPYALIAYAAQSHLNCGPSDRLLNNLVLMTREPTEATLRDQTTSRPSLHNSWLFSSLRRDVQSRLAVMPLSQARGRLGGSSITSSITIAMTPK